MTRSIIGKERVRQELDLSGLGQRAAAPRPSETVQLRRRSERYMVAIRRLDPGAADKVDVSVIVDDLLAEFGVGAGAPLGLLARCYLGAPFEVHSLDLAGGIVEHYEVGRALPSPYDRARSLALHDAYLAIEIYPDRLVCLREDGTTVELSK